MRNFISIALTTVCSIFAINYIVFAFTDATWLPPTNNVPPPLNVGSGRQTKNGDLTVQNIKASSITLGEDTRTAWPDVAGGACAWEGTRCSCGSAAAGSSGGWFSRWFSRDTEFTLQTVTAITCSGGRVTNAGLKNVGLWVGREEAGRCPTSPYGVWNCTPNLYTYFNNW